MQLDHIDSDFTAAELDWLSRNLPILSQCQLDIDAGNALAAVFAHFDHVERSCTLSCVYQSEASYSIGSTHRYNHVGSFFYRSYNQLMYKRTSDIKHMCFEGIDLAADTEQPWQTIFSTDGCGEQHFARYDRGKVGPWSFCLHHNIRIPRIEWQLQAEHQHRPLVHLNTCNHMISNLDLNTHLMKHLHVTYPILRGKRAEAQIWARQHIASKWTVQRVLNPFRWRQPQQLQHIKQPSVSDNVR